MRAYIVISMAIVCLPGRKERKRKEVGKGQGRTRENEKEGWLFPGSKICSKSITLYYFTIICR